MDDKGTTTGTPISEDLLSLRPNRSKYEYKERELERARLTKATE